MLLVWSVLVLVLSAICGVHGELVRVNWTLSGVADYRDPSNPLRTELGDMLELDCQGINSNLFIQTEQVQYDQCNASAGSGIYDYNGFCTSGVPLVLALTENSQTSMNTVNFENNHLYYFASYSTGQLGDAANKAINSGGQCLDGLKMVLQIGEIPITPGVGGNRPSEPGGPGGSDNLPIAIIAGAAGGGAALVFIGVIVCICLCCCCVSKKGKVNIIKIKGVDLEKSDATDKGKCTENQPSVINNSKSKPVKSSTIMSGSSSVDGEAKSQVNGKKSVVNEKKEENSITESKQGEVPWSKGPIVDVKKQEGVHSGGNKQDGVLTTPSPKVDTSAKTNGKSTAVSGNTTQTQTGPSKAIRNGASSSTTQNRTGAASSPSVNKASRGDKPAIHKGTAQAAAKPAAAGQRRGKPASVHRPAPPPPNAAQKHDRIKAQSSLPPTQSLPSSSNAAKHENLQVKSSLPPFREKTNEYQKKQADAVSYKSRNNAVKL